MPTPSPDRGIFTNLAWCRLERSAFLSSAAVSACGTETEQFYTHIASPEIYVDEANKWPVLWTHGWRMNKQRWPVGPRPPRAAGRGTTATASSRSRANRPMACTSTCSPAITRVSYLRVFPMTAICTEWPGSVSCCAQGSARGFRVGPNPFAGGSYADRIRHVAALLRGRTLLVFFTGIGDAPERIMLSTSISAATGQSGRRRPRWKCCGQGASSSARSAARAVGGRRDRRAARQLRDPGIPRRGGKNYLSTQSAASRGSRRPATFR